MVTKFSDKDFKQVKITRMDGSQVTVENCYMDVDEMGCIFLISKERDLNPASVKGQVKSSLPDFASTPQEKAAMDTKSNNERVDPNAPEI